MGALRNTQEQSEKACRQLREDREAYEARIRREMAEMTGRVESLRAELRESNARRGDERRSHEEEMCALRSDCASRRKRPSRPPHGCVPNITRDTELQQRWINSERCPWSGVTQSRGCRHIMRSSSSSRHMRFSWRESATIVGCRKQGPIHAVVGGASGNAGSMSYHSRDAGGDVKEACLTPATSAAE
ncbi:hypothetical protein TcBrA4_0071620 [Trypanosoma cruzi]|nr:hypothetical protein TcBrA4_0071620 [Trypanosoma cruzi]